MRTECSDQTFLFQADDRRQIVAAFDGGTITSDAGLTLLAEVDRKIGLTEKLSRCFTDHRDPSRTEHSVLHLLRQRVYALAAGYEDVVDHEQLRKDPLLASLCGDSDPTGRERRRAQDKGSALAGKSTLSRMELSRGTGSDRYKRIVADHFEIDLLLPAMFIQSQRKRPRRVILDLDTTADLVHGQQEGRFFHAHYDGYCLQALYIFCGDQPLAAKLYPGNMNAREEVLPHVIRVVEQLRIKWPRLRIMLRGDSGFQNDDLMTWCERNRVQYVFGLAKNSRLKRALGKSMAEARREHKRTEKTARVFTDLEYRTRRSWSATRRVVGKAEYMSSGENPRFVVTNIPASQWNARRLYEKLYCGRGEMENRIKEQQLDMFADRTSTTQLHSNQLRLYLSTIAYMLVEALRRLALKGTEMARAQCGRIRTQLIKIGARVRVTVRKIWVSMATGCPYAHSFAQAHTNLLRC